MQAFEPEKLFVHFWPGVTTQRPIAGRLYTLMQSDDTNELLLTIARCFAYEEIGPLRDEVLAAWRCEGSCPILVYFDSCPSRV